MSISDKAARVAVTPESTQSSRPRFAWALQVAVVVVYLAITAVFVWYGNLNQDEGYILQAARRAMQGFAPARDFFYVQTPLQPYVYGVALAPFGISILSGRILTSLFALGTLLLAMGLASRLAKSPWGGAAAGLLIVLYADMTYHNTISKTHAMTAFLLMLGFWLAMRGGRGAAWRYPLALVAVFLATATRLTAAPLGLLLLAYIWTRREGMRGPLIVCAALLALTGAWAMLVGPDRAWLNLVGYHLPNHPRPAWHVEMAMAEHLRLVAGALAGTMHRYLLVLGPPLVALVICRRRRAGGGGEALPEAWTLIAAGALLYLAHAPAGGFGHFYFSMSLPLIATGAGVMIVASARRLELAPGQWMILALACALLMALTVARSVEETRYRCTFAGETQLAQLQRVAGIVREIVPPGEELLTFSPYLAVEAGRDVPLVMSMAWWCYYPDLPTEQCRRWGVVNGELLCRLVDERRVSAAAITDAIGQKMSRQVGTEMLFKTLAINWELRWTEEHFGQLQTRLNVWSPR